MSNKRTRDAQFAARVKKIAKKRGVSTDYIYKVMRTDRNSENILSDFMRLQEEEEEVFRNMMLEQVNQLIPLN